MILLKSVRFMLKTIYLSVCIVWSYKNYSFICAYVKVESDSFRFFYKNYYFKKIYYCIY